MGLILEALMIIGLADVELQEVAHSERFAK
jgi:hypothetical protein